MSNSLIKHLNPHTHPIIALTVVGAAACTKTSLGKKLRRFFLIAFIVITAAIWYGMHNAAIESDCFHKYMDMGIMPMFAPCGVGKPNV